MLGRAHPSFGMTTTQDIRTFSRNAAIITTMPSLPPVSTQIALIYHTMLLPPYLSPALFKLIPTDIQLGLRNHQDTELGSGILIVCFIVKIFTFLFMNLNLNLNFIARIIT